jgi:hypothetical protein
MRDNQNKRDLPVIQKGKEVKENPIGYPDSPAGEDIYIKYQEEKDINPEDITKSKALNENNQVDQNNEKNYTTDVPGSDLDVPGSELDDEMEKIGSEDEENNYYSLGSDSHNYLDENQ